MHDLISTGYGPEWLGKERCFAHVIVPLILNAASDVGRLKLVLKAREAERLRCKFMHVAGEIIEEFLKELEKERKEGPVGSTMKRHSGSRSCYRAGSMEDPVMQITASKHSDPAAQMILVAPGIHR